MRVGHWRPAIDITFIILAAAYLQMSHGGRVSGMCRAFLTSPLFSQFIWAVLLMQGGTSARDTPAENLIKIAFYCYHYKTIRRIWSTGASLASSPYLVCVWVFPVVLKQVTHGPLVASGGSSATLTIQVKGVLIKSAIVHNTKGHIHLKGDKDDVKSVISGSTSWTVRKSSTRTSVVQVSELEL